MQIDIILVSIMTVLMAMAGIWGWWNEHYAPEDKDYFKNEQEKGKREK